MINNKTKELQGKEDSTKVKKIEEKKKRRSDSLKKNIMRRKEVSME